MAQFRLDKYLADAGIGTRNQVKNYIKKGMVRINDIRATRPEEKIDSVSDMIYFQEQPILMNDLEYYILNKPAGYVSATNDNTSPTVMELISTNRKDLFPVGRLDKDTEGLLLITNDGALAHRLLSPKHHVNKTYYAEIHGIMTVEDVIVFENGLEIGDSDLQRALPALLKIDSINPEANLSYVYITLQEGKYHQVKRMVHAVGKEVLYLKRISFGQLDLPKDLEIGESRPLTDEELICIKENSK